MHKNRIIEIFSLTILLTFSLLGICWGPPGPPSVPVSAPESLAITSVLIAGYGVWKMRK